MTKKKLFTTAIAVAAMTAMSTGSVFAAELTENGGSATVEGGVYPVEPIISVELPGDLSFGINPLYLDADGNNTADPQIISSDYTVKNFSNVPVAVTAKTEATVATDIEMITAPDASTSYDTNSKELKSSASDKRAVMLIMEAPTTAITVSNGEAGAMATTAYTPGQAAADIKKTGKILGAGSDGATTFVFKLAAANADVLQAGGVSGFKFSGAVDPSKNYVDSDVTVKTTYTLQTLTPAEAAAVGDATSIFKADTELTTGSIDGTTVVAFK